MTSSVFFAAFLAQPLRPRLIIPDIEDRLNAAERECLVPCDDRHPKALKVAVEVISSSVMHQGTNLSIP